MLTKILGIDVQMLAMVMLGLVGFYLVVTHATELNTFVGTLLRSWSDDLLILQGRTPKGYA